MELQLNIIGFLLICLAIVHVIFPRYFNWREELSKISLINRQMMQIHTFFIAVMVFLMGLLCVTCAKEMIETPIGQKISLGLGFFWSLRLMVQFFGYSSDLWKGKTFETVVHIAFSLLWVYLSVIFFRIGFCI
jgi:hypothetical protein